MLRVIVLFSSLHDDETILVVIISFSPDDATYGRESTQKRTEAGGKMAPRSRVWPCGSTLSTSCLKMGRTKHGASVVFWCSKLTPKAAQAPLESRQQELQTPSGSSRKLPLLPEAWRPALPSFFSFFFKWKHCLLVLLCSMTARFPAAGASGSTPQLWHRCS